MSESSEMAATGVPTFYANGLQMLVQVYEFQILFTLQTSAEKGPEAVARVHMSPQLAKVFGRLLRQNVKAYEEGSGHRVELPQTLLDQLKIAALEE